MFSRFFMPFVAFVLAPPGEAHADTFYKWVDAQGITHYAAEPPPAHGAETVDVQLQPTNPETPVPAFASQKPVVIYSTQWCGICKSAKAYFRDHHVRYTDYDVETSPKGREDYRKLGGRGVPIILVGGERMDGFSPGRFERLLEQ